MGSGLRSSGAVVTAATMVLKAAAEQGLYGLMTQSFGPQIRGGESAAYLQISDDPVYTENFEKDLVICFRFSDAERFKSEFAPAPGSVVIHEAGDKDSENSCKEPVFRICARTCCCWAY
jgi:2-oxoglutarate ferredoxin oxidoreductase subunit alpha